MSASTSSWFYYKETTQLFVVFKKAKIVKCFILRTEFVKLNLSLDTGCFGGVYWHKFRLR